LKSENRWPKPVGEDADPTKKIPAPKGPPLPDEEAPTTSGPNDLTTIRLIESRLIFVDKKLFSIYRVINFTKRRGAL